MKKAVRVLKQIFLTLTALLAVSCSRPSSDTAKVKIALPSHLDSQETQIYASSYVSNLLMSSNISDNQLYSSSENVIFANEDLTDEWSSAQVTGFSGLKRLNCFFVTASTPEKNIVNCNRNNTVVHSFSSFAGPTRASTELTMDVYAGKARKFSLFGMYAESKSACVGLLDSLFVKGYLSRPYLIGESADTDIFAGIDNEVRISVFSTFSDEKYLENCNLDKLNSTPSVAREIEIKIPTNLYGSVGYINQCVPLVVKFRSNSMNSYVPSPLTLSHRLLDSASSTIATYETAKQCLTSEGPQNDFTSTGKIETVRWLKATTAMDNTVSDFRLDGVTSYWTNASTSTFTLNTNLIADMRNLTKWISTPASATEKRPQISIPKKIINGVCTPITFTMNNVDGSSADFSFPATSTFRAQSLSSVPGETLTFFTDSSCTLPNSIGASEINESTIVSGTASLTRYFKANNVTSYGQMTLSVTAASPLINASLEFDVKPSISTYTTSTGSSIVPKRLDIIGPTFAQRDFPTDAFWPRCIGPFRVHMADAAGGYIKENIARTVNVVYGGTLTSSASATTFLYKSTANDVQCIDTSQIISSGGTLTIDGSTGYADFYLKVLDPEIQPTNASSYYKYIKVFTSDSLLVKPATHLFTINSASMTTTIPSPPSDGDPVVTDEITVGPN